MGALSKSVLILLVAISTPLLYRQFATDNTIKFMSAYYSDYKVIDQFMRQSAGHLDRAKEYLPDKTQINNLLDNVHFKVNKLIAATQDKIKEFSSPEAKDANHATGPEKGTSESITKKSSAVKSTQSHKMTDCPGEEGSVRLWSKEDLAKFDGSSTDEVYLAFLGLVYNVTMNAQHYGPGSEYSSFAGRDATRAFVTGNFTHDLNDDIRDIEDSFYAHVESWASFYSNSYQALGRVEGAFFDSHGCGTPELGRIYQKFNQLAQDRIIQQEESKNLPECNSEWNSDLKSGRVWCTTKSGGIERDWVGVPRLVEESDSSPSSKCVCVNQGTLDSSQQDQFKVYADCDPNANECKLNHA